MIFDAKTPQPAEPERGIAGHACDQRLLALLQLAAAGDENALSDIWREFQIDFFEESGGLAAQAQVTAEP